MENHKIQGEGGSPGIAAGPVRIIKKITDIKKAKKDEILVLRHLRPELVTVINKISAIVVENGSRESHVMIMLRESGMPCVYDVNGFSKKIKNGKWVKINGRTGNIEIINTKK